MQCGTGIGGERFPLSNYHPLISLGDPPNPWVVIEICAARWVSPDPSPTGWRLTRPIARTWSSISRGPAAGTESLGLRQGERPRPARLRPVAGDLAVLLIHLANELRGDALVLEGELVALQPDGRVTGMPSTPWSRLSMSAVQPSPVFGFSTCKARRNET